MSKIEDRRQRAREAAYDQMPVERLASSAWDIERAIKVATQVKITQEAIWAHTAPGEQIQPLSNAEIRAKIAGILTALGFEVVD